MYRLTDEEKDRYIEQLYDEVLEEDLLSEVDENNEEEVEIANNSTVSDVEDADENENEPHNEAEVDEDNDEDENDEDEIDEDDTEAIDLRALEYVARDGTVWRTEPRHARQTRQHNILRQRSGPARSTATLSILNTFKLLMSPDMVNLIIRYTNQKAENTYSQYNESHPETPPKTWKAVTMSEMYAFIGVLIMTGSNRSNGETVTDLWSVENCPLYRAAMGINRFHDILRFIRFDDSNTRRLRLQSDKSAPISDLWNMMNMNLEHYYKPSENLTVDEQLFPYRGRTRFTQYIPSKPAKYGIKVWWVCDSKNSYPLHGQIYTGQRATGREVNQGERVVKDLVSRFHGSGRNITMDNFFTTANLLEHLLSLNLTAVGTVRKNKRFVPREMLPHKDREEGSSLFGFTDTTTICSYVPKKRKAVILMSTLHDDNAIGESGKPEMIEFYNQTKGGVDVMDQMLGEYTCQRSSKRWPLSFFFNIIDLTALAAYIIFYENNANIPPCGSRRKRFLRQLAKELSMPIIEERSVNLQVMRNFNTKIAVASFIRTALHDAHEGTVLQPITAASGAPGSRARQRKTLQGSCHICYIRDQQRRRTRNLCSTCQKPICLEHSINFYTCILCSNRGNN